MNDLEQRFKFNTTNYINSISDDVQSLFRR